MFPSPEWFEAWGVAISNDREIETFGRWSTLNFTLRSGEEVFLVRLREGRLRKIVEGHDTSDPQSFTLAGEPEDWEAFLQEIPPPFYHDLLAMNTRVETFSIEGDLHVFVQHIRTIKRIFRIAQSLGARIA